MEGNEMGRSERFNEYIESVLKGVRFKEAHDEIREELKGHLEEAKELSSGLGVPDEKIESQVITRMGDPQELGASLDRVHKPRIDSILFGLVSILVIIGSFGMFQLDRLGLHGLWLALGSIPLVVLMLLRPRSIQRHSWAIFAATAGLGSAAALVGPWHEGQPYLQLGPITLKVVDLSVALFTLSLAGPISKITRSDRNATVAACTGVLSPLIVYALIGSFFPALLFLVACLAMLIAARQSRRILVGLATLGTGLVVSALGRSSFISSDTYSTAIASERHTDFAFLTLSNYSVLLSALTAVVAVTLIAYLWSICRTVKSSYGRTASAGATAVISFGIAWGTLSNIGFVPMPNTGVYFPFLSYSGSLAVAHLALVGLVLGIQRRRNLHFA